MTLGSVITETIFISAPHAGHKSGSTSKMRRSSRAQLAREGEGDRFGVRIGRGAHVHASALDLLDDVDRHRPAGQVARKTLGAVQALEHAAAEDLLDEPRVEVRQLQELSLLIECAVGDEGVHVGMEVGGVGAERPGVTVELELGHRAGRKHLPVVLLRRVA
jgi:hypothetical protein